jgi:hypothetical protein
VDSNIESSVNDIQIKSRDGLSSARIDCQGRPCMNLRGNSVVIDSLHVSNGASSTLGGCFTVNAQKLITIRQSRFNMCTSSLNGGALLVQSGGKLILSDSTIENSTAANYGGALFAESLSNLAISDCNLTTSQAVRGGGIAMFQATATMQRSMVILNRATLRGGAVDSDQSTLSVATTTVSNNSAPTGGGVNLQDSTVAMDAVRVTSNVAVATGGGIYIGFSSLALSNSHVSSNTVAGALESAGGGFYCLGQRDISLLNVRMENNRADSQGGAIALVFCSPVIDRSFIVANSAREGGAMLISLQAVVKVIRTSITQVPPFLLLFLD